MNNRKEDNYILNINVIFPVPNICFVNYCISGDVLSELNYPTTWLNFLIVICASILGTLREKYRPDILNKLRHIYTNIYIVVLRNSILLT